MQNRFTGVDLFRIFCLRKGQVERGQVFDAVDQVLGVVADLGREFCQHAAFFVAFGQFQFADLVVQFHHRSGSTNSVAPEDDWSCTTDLIRPLNSERSGMT
jgi:hypothetical protein